MYELLKAIINHNDKEIEKLLDSNPNLIYVPDEKEGITPLTLAAVVGNAALVRRLIRLGAPLNNPLQVGPLKEFTPLILAILGDHVDIVKIMLEYDVDINLAVKVAESSQGTLNTEIYNIIKPILDLWEKAKAKFLVVEEELSSQFSGVSVPTNKISTWSPLQFASALDNKEISNLLIDKKRSTLGDTQHNQPNKNDKALPNVSEVRVNNAERIDHSSSSKTIRFLPNSSNISELMTHFEIDPGQFLKAIIDKKEKQIEVILNFSPQLVFKISGAITPLALAAAVGNAKLVQRLITMGAPFKEPLHTGPFQGRSPLILAILGQHQDVIQVLIENKVDLNQEFPLPKEIECLINDEVYKIIKPVCDALLKVEKNNLEKKNNSDNKRLLPSHLGIIYFSTLTPLFAAIMTRNVNIIMLLLENGADPIRETSKEYNTAFAYSNSQALDAISTILAQHIKDPHQMRKEGEFAGVTPFYSAAYFGMTKTVEYFLNNGANANDIIKFGKLKGYSAIYSAAAFGQTDTVRLLMNAGAEYHKVLNKIGQEYTPLVVAAMNGHIDVVKLFIEEGKVAYKAPMNTGEYLGTNALHHAIGGGHLDITQYLIDRGCDCDEVITEGKFKGDVPLYFAIVEKNEDMVKLLIRNGADYKKFTVSLNGSMCIPLIRIYEAGFTDLTKKLITEDKKLFDPLDSPSDLYKGVTLLYLILNFGADQPVRKFLFEIAKFDINQTVASGRFAGLTTLEMAAKVENTIVLKELKKLGAKFEKTKEYLMSGAAKEVQLLYAFEFISLQEKYEIDNMKSANVNRVLYAILGQNIDVLKIFLTRNKIDKPLVTSQYDIEYPVTLTSKTIKMMHFIAIHSGVTPLYLAAQLGYVKVVEWLLKNKASVNLRLQSGTFQRSTPLHIAVRNGHIEVVKLLMQYKASPSYTDKDSLTAREIAVKLDKTEIVKLLEDYELEFKQAIPILPKQSSSNTDDQRTIKQVTKNEPRTETKESTNAQTCTFIETQDSTELEIAEMKRQLRLQAKEEKLLKAKAKEEKINVSSTQVLSDKKDKSNKTIKKHLNKKVIDNQEHLNPISTTSESVQQYEVSESATQQKLESQKNQVQKVDPTQFLDKTPVIILDKKILRANDTVSTLRKSESINKIKKKSSKNQPIHATHSAEESGIIETAIHYTQSISAALSDYNKHKNDESKDTFELIRNELSWLFMRLFESLAQYNDMLALAPLDQGNSSKSSIADIGTAVTLRNRIRYLNNKVTITDLINFTMAFEKSVAPNIEKLRSNIFGVKNICLNKLTGTNLFKTLATAYKELCKNMNLSSIRFNILQIDINEFELKLENCITKLKQFTKPFRHKADAHQFVHHISACNFIIDYVIRISLALNEKPQSNEKYVKLLYDLLDDCTKLRNTLGHEMYETQYDKSRHMFIESPEPIKTYEIASELIEYYDSYKKLEKSKVKEVLSQDTLSRFSQPNRTLSSFFEQVEEKDSNDERHENENHKKSSLKFESKPFVPGKGWD